MSQVVGYTSKIAHCAQCGAVIEYTDKDTTQPLAGGAYLQCPSCRHTLMVPKPGPVRRPTVEETYRAGQLVSRIER